MAQGFLTRAEVLNYLGSDPETLEGFIRSRRLKVFKIGGQFERFSKEEVVALKSSLSPRKLIHPGRHRDFFDLVVDFWHYNNFYIVISLVLAAIIYFLFVR